MAAHFVPKIFGLSVAFSWDIRIFNEPHNGADHVSYFFAIIENHAHEVGTFRAEGVTNFPAALDLLDAHLLTEYRGRNVVGVLRRR